MELVFLIQESFSGEASKGSGGSGGAIPVESTAGRAAVLGPRKVLVTRPGTIFITYLREVPWRTYFTVIQIIQ